MKITCPIHTIDIPGVPGLEMRGLIVVVGPTSSGKTQFLCDINETLCGRHRELVVASGVTFRKPPPFDEYFDFLIEKGSIRETSPGEFLKNSLQYGADTGAGPFRKSQIKSQYRPIAQAIR